MTLHDAYSLYHKYCVLAKTGTMPKPIKDFSSIDSNEENKQYFLRFIEMAERSGGSLDVDLYFRSLAEYHKGFYTIKTISAPSAMKIYRNFIAELNNRQDPTDIKQQIVSDCSFVANFCADNGISSLVEYINHNKEMIPTIAIHCRSHKISHFFLGCIYNFDDIISSYPPDCCMYFEGFNYKLTRSKVAFAADTRIIADNIDYIIDSSILKILESKNIK